MATISNQTYHNLEELVISSNDSFINCTFSNISRILITAPVVSFAGCSFTNIQDLSASLYTSFLSDCSFTTVRITGAAIKLYPLGNTFTDSIISPSTVYLATTDNPAIFSIGSGNTFKSVLSWDSSITSGSISFYDVDLTGAALVGTSSKTITMTTCKVDCTVNSYSTLNNCFCDREVVLTGSHISVNGGSYSQITSYVVGSSTINPSSVRKTVFPGLDATSDCVFKIAKDTNWEEHKLPNISGDNNTVYDLNNYTFLKKSRTFGYTTTFHNPSYVTFPNTQNTPIMLGTIKGCNLNGLKSTDLYSSVFEDTVSEYNTFSLGLSNTTIQIRDNCSFQNSIFYTVLASNNVTFGWGLGDTSPSNYQVVKNLNLRGATFDRVIQENTLFVNCNFVGTTFKAGTLTNVKFMDCVMDSTGLSKFLGTNTNVVIDESCTTQVYEDSANTLSQDWSTVDISLGVPLTLAAKEGRALSINLSSNAFTSYLSGAKTCLWLLKYNEALALSSKPYTVDAGVVPATITNSELDTLCVGKWDTSTIGYVNISVTYPLITGVYFIVIRNYGDTTQNVTLAGSADYSGFEEWSGSGVSSSKVCTSGMYSAWKYTVTGSSKYITTSQNTEYVAWFLDEESALNLAPFVYGGVATIGSSTISEATLDYLAYKKITTGLYGSYDKGSTDNVYLIIKHTNAHSNFYLSDTLIPLVNSWSTDSNTIRYYNFGRMSTGDTSIDDLSIVGKDMTITPLVGSSNIPTRTFGGLSLSGVCGFAESIYHDILGTDYGTLPANFRIDLKIRTTPNINAMTTMALLFGDMAGNLTGGFYCDRLTSGKIDFAFKGTDGSTYSNSSSSNPFPSSTSYSYDLNLSLYQVYDSDLNQTTITCTMSGYNNISFSKTFTGTTIWADGSHLFVGNILGKDSASSLIDFPVTIKEMLVQKIDTAPALFPFRIDDNTVSAYSFIGAVDGCSSFEDIKGSGRNLSVMEQTNTSKESTINDVATHMTMFTSGGVHSTATISADGWELNGTKYGIYPDTLGGLFTANSNSTSWGHLLANSSISIEVRVKFHSFSSTANMQAVVSLLGLQYFVSGGGFSYDDDAYYGMEIQGGNTAGSTKGYIIPNTWFSSLETPEAALTAETWYIIKLVYNYSNQTLTLYKNGTQVGSSVPYVKGLKLSTTCALAVGRRSYNISNSSTTVDAVISHMSISKTVR